MVLLTALLAVMAGVAAAAPPVRVAIPAGEAPADWSALAGSVGFALADGATPPGCPGVVITREADAWRVAVCREDGGQRALLRPVGADVESRDAALLGAASLLYGLGAVEGEVPATPRPPLAPVEALAGLVEAPARSTERPDAVAASVGVAADALSPSTGWLAPATAPPRARSPGRPWLTLGAGGRVRASTAGAAVAAAGLGWAWRGGAQVGLHGELTGSQRLTLPALAGLDAEVGERALSASAGFGRGPAAAAVSAGWSRWDVRQDDAVNATVSILWIEGALYAPLTRAGPVALGPELRVRYDYRGGEIYINGAPDQLLPPAAVTIGLKARLSTDR